VRAFYASEWFLPTVLTAIAALAFIACQWLKRRELRQAMADRRICDAHLRNMAELPEIDGGGRG
jgi:hypothetical protein